MRICDVNNFYTPTGGGVRVYHERKLEYFADHPEHAYALLAPAEREGIRRVGAATIYDVPAAAIGGSGYRMILSRRALARAFDDFAPDLVEIGSPYVLPLLVPAALGRRPAATVGFVHADYPDTYVAPAMSRWPGLGGLAAGLARRHMGAIYRRMDATLAASEYVLRKLRRLGVERLFHAPLGVEASRFCPAARSPEVRARLGAGPDRALLLFMGRLAPEKGIDLLIDTYPAIRDPDRLTLVIAGHGPAEERVAALCARYPEIVRAGPMARDEVAAAMASADLFLALGAHETFSLCTLEALACGTPVVAPAAGGAAELIDRFGGGRTFAPGSADALAAAIADALAAPRPDGDALHRRIAEGHDWPAVFHRLVGVYEAIHAARRARDPARLRAPDGWWPPGEAPLTGPV